MNKIQKDGNTKKNKRMFVHMFKARRSLNGELNVRVFRKYL
jgi:hypothetical protein